MRCEVLRITESALSNIVPLFLGRMEKIISCKEEQRYLGELCIQSVVFCVKRFKVT